MSSVFGRFWGEGSVGEAHSEVRDALEDLVKETVGAMEITGDYYAHRNSCHTHAHTSLCVEEGKHAAIQAMLM